MSDGKLFSMNPTKPWTFDDAKVFLCRVAELEHHRKYPPTPRPSLRLVKDEGPK